jgi:hypothetical protein
MLHAQHHSHYDKLHAADRGEENEIARPLIRFTAKTKH